MEANVIAAADDLARVKSQPSRDINSRKTRDDLSAADTTVSERLEAKRGRYHRSWPSAD